MVRNNGRNWWTKITGALKADPMSVLPELSPIVFPVLYIKPFSLLNLEQPSVRMP